MNVKRSIIFLTGNTALQQLCIFTGKGGKRALMLQSISQSKKIPTFGKFAEDIIIALGIYQSRFINTAMKILKPLKALKSNANFFTQKFSVRKIDILGMSIKTVKKYRVLYSYEK